MSEFETQLEAIHQRLDFINLELGKLIGSMRTVNLLVKFVILPLILILGGLIGIKLWG